MVRHTARLNTIVAVDQANTVNMEIESRRLICAVSPSYRPRLMAIIDTSPGLQADLLVGGVVMQQAQGVTRPITASSLVIRVGTVITP